MIRNADTKNITEIAVELGADARYRPWIDFYVGDRIWVDIGAGLPAGWWPSPAWTASPAIPSILPP